MLVERHQQSMLRLARTLVSSEAVAEEVVQDTWLGCRPWSRPVRRALLAPHVVVPDPGQSSAFGRIQGAQQHTARVCARRRSRPLRRSRAIGPTQ